ncbi:MAG TPA: thioredoxin family protein, partial [Bacteroidia bacterium]|nr:thioredoxin family protein [Bacteroidia bacterium]
ITWAQKNVVLLELDFPRRKQLPPDLAKQNNDLQQTFQVQGFPTVWLFNTEPDTKANTLKISALGNLGYPSSAEPGKEEIKFLATANSILGLK